MRKTFALLLICLESFTYGQNIEDSLITHFNNIIIPDSLMNKGNISDPLYLIKGRVAGLTMSRGSGHPMNYESVFIRGMASRGWNNSPMYIIDGIPGADPYSLFPEDIKSINVIKNISNTALYGIYGGNGVIKIETKKTTGDAFHASYSSVFSFDEPSYRLDLLSPSEYRAAVQDYADLHGYSYDEIFDDNGASTDWQDEVFKKVISHHQNVSVSQRIKNTSYRLSLNYIDQPGLMIQSGMEKIGGSGFVSQSLLNDKLKVNFSFRLTNQMYNGISLNDANTVLYQVYRRLPTNPTNMDILEGYPITPFGYIDFDPVTFLNGYNNDEKTNRQFYNLHVNYEFNKELSFSILSGCQNTMRKRALLLKENLDLYYIYGNALNRQITDEHYFITGQVDYRKRLANNSTLKFHADYSFYKNTNFGDTLDYNHIYQRENDNTNAVTGYIKYCHKSGLSIDYTSRLDLHIIETSKSYQKTYWSQGLTIGWDITKILPIKNIEKIDYIKMQYNAGKAYSKPIPNRTNYYSSLYSSSFNNNTPTIENTFSLLSSAFNHKLNVQLNVYLRKTGNEHNVRFHVPYNQISYSNYKYDVINKGLELAINYFVISKKEFSWNTVLNYHFNENTIENIDDFLIPYIYSRYGDVIFVDGESLYTFCLPEFAYIVGENVYYFDETGQPTQSASDARKTKASVFPDYQIGWQNYFTAGPFSLSLSMRYVHGNYIYNIDRFELSHSTFLHNNALVSEMNVPIHNITQSDLYLENASYLKLDNIVLNYTFELNKLNYIGTIDLYIGAKNLFTATGYSGLNPEIDYERPLYQTENYVPDLNYDLTGISAANGYPALRSYFVGLKINF